MTTSVGAWRYVPLLSSIDVYAAGALTFGVGFLAFPVAVVSTVLAFRRTAPPRGFVFWLGSVASAVVSAAGVVALAIVIAVLVGDLFPIALFCPFGPRYSPLRPQTARQPDGRNHADDAWSPSNRCGKPG